ncbi:MAG: hypothetical protein K0V04_29780 [Deltaproteobacteria bacterium]|nr:hypothetical protein [Deltaproteobacteria bacterium]
MLYTGGVDAVLRLLDLVRRELRARDAYVRLGAPPTDDPLLLVHELRPGCMLVVALDEQPPDRNAAQHRIAELAQAFTSTVHDAMEVLETGLTHPPGDELTQVLADLRDATSAEVALVVDRQSPVVWGCSEPGLPLRDRPAARRLAAAFEQLGGEGEPASWWGAAKADEPEAGPTQHARRALREAERDHPGAAGRLVTAVRALVALDDPACALGQPPQPNLPGITIKEIAGLYQVVLAFEQPYSPLRAEGVMRRALPVIERHVLELPPLDPTPKGGRVLPLRRD